MAINLGNIRSAGFRKGLATGFIKSEAAKADADRREKEYQQLLAREQANREFQASQSLLNRDASTEQARLKRQQTQQNADRTFARSVLEYNKAEAARIAKQKKEAIKNDTSAVQSRITALGPALDKSHISSLEKLYPNLAKGAIKSLVDYTILGTKNTLSRDEEKLLNKGDDDILADLNKGNIRGEAAIRTMLNSKFIKRMIARGIFTTEDTLPKLAQRYSSIYQKKIAGSINIDTKNTSYSIGGKEYVIPSNTAFMSQLKSGGEDGRLSLFSGRLNQWNFLFQNALDDKIKPNDIVKSSAYKSFISQKDLLQSKNKKDQKIYTLKNYKALDQLLNIDPDVITPKPTAPASIKRKSEDTQLTPQKPDDFELQVFSRDGDELTPASSILVANDIQQGVDLNKLGGMHPADTSTDRNLENYSQLRTIKEAKSYMASWKENRYREGTALDNLVNFMRTKGGSLKGQEGQDIIEAVLYLEPDNVIVRNANRSYPRANKIYDTEGTKGKTAEIVIKANEQVRGSQEAIEMITSIKDIVSSINNNSLGVGASLEMFTSDLTTAAQGVAQFAQSRLGSLGGLAKNMLSKVMGGDETLDQLRQQAQTNVSASVGSTSSFVAEREKRTQYFRDMAEEAYKDTDSKLAKGDITAEQASLRKLVVLKKMALTYRLSGLFQGDSSGRTISNQDYDVAASALWGELYSFDAKMIDLQEFFNARVTRFGAVAQFANDKAVGLADRVTNAVIKQDSSDYIQRVIGENKGSGMYVSSVKPKTTLQTTGQQIKEKINEAMSNDDNLRGYGDTSKLSSHFGNELFRISPKGDADKKELIPPATSILNTQLPETSKWVKNVTDISNLMFEKAYPTPEAFKETFKDPQITYEGMKKIFRMSVFKQAYKVYSEKEGG